MSPKLWDELNRWAEEDLRSVNAQIEYLLREAVLKKKPSADLSDSKGEEGD
jgi:hypothetical protein